MSAQEDADVAAAAKAWEVAMYGSDLQWWEESGNCGGCGDPYCHPERPCGNARGYYHDICDICPERAGEVRW